MKISVLTLFPEYFEPLMTTSILKRAKEKDLFEFETSDFIKDVEYGGAATFMKFAGESDVCLFI